MAEKQTTNSDTVLEEIVASPYKYGFKTEIETEDFPKGITNHIIHAISKKKNEPLFCGFANPMERQMKLKYR